MNDIKVVNVTLHDVGLRRMNGIDCNIKAGLFAYLSKEDIEYNMAIAPSLFEPPMQLVVQDEELNNVLGITADTEICNKETVEKKLKGTAAKLKVWLEENNKPHVLEQVYQCAMEMEDLPANKLKVLKSFMPLRDFGME